MLYPPADRQVKAGDGRTVKVGKDNYINRLVIFCESRTKSGISVKVMSSELRYIGERLDAVFSGVQKGSHAQIDLSEAQRFVIHTYLLIGDILDLYAETSHQVLSSELLAEFELPREDRSKTFEDREAPDP